MSLSIPDFRKAVPSGLRRIRAVRGRWEPSARIHLHHALPQQKALSFLNKFASRLWKPQDVKQTGRLDRLVRSSHSTYSSDFAPVTESAPPAVEGIITAGKMKLLAALSSLDRGLAANTREAADVEKLAARLEKLGEKVSLPAEKLSGNWRLVYSSAFNTGNLGGSRPGPPAALLPTTLGQVYQRIDDKGKLDNIVELLISVPQLPLASWLGLAGPDADTARESPAVRLTLKHDYEITEIGGNTVQIVFEDTTVEFVGSSMLSSVPKLFLPSLPEALKPPRFLRSAKFDVTFLDAQLRVTRGDRGELRLYLRDSDLGMPARPPDYED